MTKLFKSMIILCRLIDSAPIYPVSNLSISFCAELIFIKTMRQRISMEKTINLYCKPAPGKYHNPAHFRGEVALWSSRKLEKLLYNIESWTSRLKAGHDIHESVHNANLAFLALNCYSS